MKAEINSTKCQNSINLNHRLSIVITHLDFSHIPLRKPILHSYHVDHNMVENIVCTTAYSEFSSIACQVWYKVCVQMIQISSLYFRQYFKIDLVMTSGSLSTVIQNVLTDFSRILPSQPTSNILGWNRNNPRCCKYHMNVDRSTTFLPPSLRLCSFLPSLTRRNRHWCLYTLSLWTHS